MLFLRSYARTAEAKLNATFKQKAKALPFDLRRTIFFDFDEYIKDSRDHTDIVEDVIKR